MPIKVVTICVFAFLLLTCGNSSLQSPIDQRSALVVLDSVITLGEVNVDSVAIINYYLVCQSPTPLVIKGVDSGCHCTVAGYPKKPIPQGDSANITLRFTPEKEMKGNIEKTVVVSTNAEKRFVVLKFRCTVK